MCQAWSTKKKKFQWKIEKKINELFAYQLELHK